MEFTHLGNTGLQVSRICLGTMTYSTPTERWPEEREMLLEDEIKRLEEPYQPHPVLGFS